jgi:hypothetical protein
VRRNSRAIYFAHHRRDSQKVAQGEVKGEAKKALETVQRMKADKEPVSKIMPCIQGYRVDGTADSGIVTAK